VPSAALARWHRVQLARLVEIENAHRAVGGRGPGRRVATQQINDAYMVLLAGQWQEFCRYLHTEAADIVAQAMPSSAQVAVQLAFTLGRNLDRGNATPENISRDFARFGMNLWRAVYSLDARNRARRHRLDQLYVWRNAIAHQDLPPTGDRARKVDGTRRTLEWAKRFEGACTELAAQLDRAIRDQLRSLTGVAPW
jgi:hypothetical protein